MSYLPVELFSYEVPKHADSRGVFVERFDTLRVAKDWKRSVEETAAAVERSDTCVVQAAGVVAESACAFVLADFLLEKFGTDSLLDIKQAYKAYLKRIV